MKRHVFAGIAIVLALVGVAQAGDAVFTVIGPGMAVDMTPDGQYVLINGGDGATIWNAGDGLTNIGGHFGAAISDDGMMVLGEITDPDTGLNVAGLWTEATGWVSLGGLPGQTGCDANLSNPYDLSGAGDIAVGLGWEGCDGRAFRWTEETDMEALRQLGPNSARANAISGDGMVIGGWDEDPTGPRRASVWFPDGTEELILQGEPNNAEGIGEVWAFSSDGSVVVGQAHQDINTGGGFRYLNGKVDIIQPLPGTDPFFFTTAGLAVSDDGALVGGTNISGFGPFALRNGIVWTQENGTEIFQDILLANGAVIPDGLLIASIEAMSPDGETFAGFAIEPPFAQVAYIATLAGPAQPGACCFEDGSCEELLEEECITGGGVFQGEGLTCDPNPCPAPPVTATLDIRPDSCPNPFNPMSRGLLPVALLGSDSFDVNEVDLASLSIAGVAPITGPPGPAPEYEDVASPGSGEVCECSEDGLDGLTDLVLKFSIPALVEALGLANGAGNPQLCLTGTLLDGSPFTACDCISLVPPQLGSGAPAQVAN